MFLQRRRRFSQAAALTVSGGGGGWTPASLGSALKIWCSADSGTSSTVNGTNLTSWNDRSGNSNNLTNQGFPKYDTTDALNGLPVIDINTSPNSGFRTTSTFALGSTSSISFFAVIKSKVFSGSNGRIFGLNLSGTDNGAGGGTFMYFPASTGLLWQRNGNLGGVTPPLSDGAWLMLGLIIQPGTNQSNMYCNNGSALASVSTFTDSNGAFTSPATNLDIMANPSTGSEGGFLAEFFMTNTAMGSTDIANTYSYFHSRYALS